MIHRRSSIIRASGREAFTLLELCMVMFIIALLAGAAMPAMESAFTEQNLRGDSHRFSMMVKTAMIQSQEQNRPYTLVLDGKDFSMQPAKPLMAESDAESAPPATKIGDEESGSAPPLDDVTMNLHLANIFQLADAKKKDAWDTIPTMTWIFQPAGLCPLPRVRISRGKAWIEMSFNALTGNVEDEATYIP